MEKIFEAAQKTGVLIGREKEIELIRHAVFSANEDCRIIFIKGHGGYGKTRLMEDILWRLGNPEQRQKYPFTPIHKESGLDWADFERVIPANLVDLIDNRLHSSNRFLQAVRESLGWAGLHSLLFNFNRYESARSEYEKRLLDNADYRLTREAAEQAGRAFEKDYTQIVGGRRVVLAIDTAEQLTIRASSWLINEGLLEEAKIHFQTHQWILEAIKSGLLANTTLLIAGRDREGEKPFYDEFYQAALEKGIECAFIEAERFTERDIQAYFSTLAQEWEQAADRSDQEQAKEECMRISGSFDFLASSTEQIEILETYTNGQPVLLSLFADVIIEGPRFPEELRRLPEDSAGIEYARWKLEEKVIELLFRMPHLEPQEYADRQIAETRLKSLNLRRQVLLALVRAPLGLTAEQIHFLIDNPSKLTPKGWVESVYSSERVQQIEAVMNELNNLSLVKARPGGITFVHRDKEVEIRADLPALRLGLQDEVYRIYAEHMSPHIHLGRPLNETEQENRDRLDRLWERFSVEDRGYYQRNFEDEVNKRRSLNIALREWAYYLRKRLRSELKDILEKEEQVIEITLYRSTPADAHTARIRIDPDEADRRKQVRRAMWDVELEYLNYAFLLDPAFELNDAYPDLADDQWRANNEEADIQAQALIWRILLDPFALKFVRWGPLRSKQLQFGEQDIDTLRRVARLEDATRWIKRLALRNDYASCLEFSNRLEEYIRAMPEGREKSGWQHTFSAGERLCWREFAIILSGTGEELETAITRLEEAAEDLVRLVRYPMGEVAISRTGEEGFLGHPAEFRLRRLISYVYSNLGYAAAQLGRIRKAVEYYGRALAAVREPGVGAKSHHATVLNNLSRALSDMGRNRAVHICLDGLALRKELGADQPIGLSHSTLALILNDQNNPDRAWVEAAKAILYFQRVEDYRGKGLADIQFGEALRRIAAQANYGRAFPASREQLYQAAEEVLNEAVGIFILEDPTPEEQSQGNVKEPIRWIEARIEKGCLFRDQVSYLRREKPDHDWRTKYSNAVAQLTDAMNVAQQGWQRLYLDALVNLAWTHYYAGKIELTLNSIETALDLIATIIQEPADLLRRGRDLPRPDEFDAYIFYQLSKIHNLRARLAMDEFTVWVEERTHQLLKEDMESDPKFARRSIRPRIRQELEMNPHGMDRAAREFLIGTYYAKLYSPRSTALGYVHETLYSYMKKLNRLEMEIFVAHLRADPLLKRGDEMQLEDIGNLQEFLKETIGILD